MGFVKLFVAMRHVEKDSIEVTYRRWLKADAVIGDPEALDVLAAHHAAVKKST